MASSNFSSEGHGTRREAAERRFAPGKASVNGAVRVLRSLFLECVDRGIVSDEGGPDE